MRVILYLRLMRFDRPIGIYLLLWPTLWALWIAAGGWPEPKILCIFVLGVITMRASGCVINDITDRDIDIYVARTANRPLASKQVSLRGAWCLFFALLLFAFVLVCQLNHLTIMLSLLGAGLTIIYPWCKRFTHLPQVVLGLTFAWSVPMAFAAQTGSIPMLAWFLYFTVVLWIVAYDTMYAMADREEDLHIGVKSTAILFANYDRALLAGMQICILLALLGLGLALHLHYLYYATWLVASTLAGYQQYLLKDRTPAKCFQAFLNNHWLGLVIFIGLFLSLR